MNICVVGAGYVGLTTAAALAKLNHRVWCVDKDEQKIALLSRGKLSFYEPGLEDLVKNGLDGRVLEFTTSLEEGVRDAAIIFIAVGTPLSPQGGVDLDSIYQVVNQLQQLDLQDKMVIIKSTVPPGTTDEIDNLLNNDSAEEQRVWVGITPEFLREGSALYDFFLPDRIIIGCRYPPIEDTLRRLYRGFTCPILVTQPPMAETIKYGANAFLAMKISYVNELANLCDLLGVDVVTVLQGVGLDKRIGSSYLQPGVGYGGSCLPKDLSSLVFLGQQFGHPMELLRAVQVVNAAQPQRLIDRLLAKVKIGDKGLTIALLGLAFKAETDDTRFSPALRMIEQLTTRGVDIRAYDPAVKDVPEEYKHSTQLVSSIEEAVNGVDGVIIATEWEEFREVNWEKLRDLMRQPVILDGRNVLDPQEMKQFGFYYLGVGRSNGTTCS